MSGIKIENLTKEYKDLKAVDNLNLEINEGELFALLGVNGAGKTTTVKMLSCLLKPTSGDAILNGKSIVKDSMGVKNIIGISPQETAVAPNLTVKENLEFICSIYGFKKDETQKKIQDMTETFSFNEILKKRAGKLSGGWQRKLSIAMALIADPEIIFLDEPTLGLDVISRSELWDTIRDLKGKKTVILTTHYMEEAEELSDRIGIMKSGKLLKVGKADEIIKECGAESLEKAFIKIVKGEK